MWNCSECSEAQTDLSFRDFSTAQAGSADADTFSGALHLGANGPQIDVPSSPADIVGVTDIVSELRPLAAHITYLCHDFSR